jgi:hypothetical protein
MISKIVFDFFNFFEYYFIKKKIEHANFKSHNKKIVDFSKNKNSMLYI